ncbi:MAG: sensor-containing diguanylate cyclase/phosphodiesterase [Bacillales bacterium]|jgi:diguanylate cyclase (GGDEF)-like protein/PAS domain S-box-containing protein|nr:sensor-containing diguanylate cyclase/phosphodiesterase [Bacillales bacterium]
MLIKRKLPLMFIVLCALPLIFLSFIVYHFSSDSLVKSSKNHIMETTKLESDVLNSLIREQRTEVELAAKRDSVIQFLNNRLKENDTKELRDKEASKLASELNRRVKEVGYLRRSFVIDSNGNITIDNNNELKGMSLSDRSYFKNGMKGKSNISEVLHSKVDGQPMVVLAAPVKDESGRIIGVFCFEFYTEFFVRFTSTIKIGETGYAYIIDKEGRVIAHPKKGEIGNVPNNKKIQEIFKNLTRDDKSKMGMDSYTYNNQSKYMGYSYIPELKWVLVVAQNIEEVFAPAKFVLYIIIGITILMIIISTVLSVLASRSITMPISKLTESMNRASEGELTSVCDYKSKNELGQLSSNFNHMIKKLGSSYQDLAQLNEELSAQQEEIIAQNDELIASQRKLTQSEERYKQALNGINDVIWEIDLKTHKLFASEKWVEVIGYQLEDVHLRKFLKNIILPEYRQLVFEDIKNHINLRTSNFSTELKVKTGNGEIKWILNRGNVLYDNSGNPIKLAGALTDISDNKITEERIQKLAFFDTLTNLPNRTVFFTELQKEIQKCEVNRTNGAVLFLDLDNFKIVNDSLGHDVGDVLLQEISGRLSSVLELDDMLCRFGGDEFLILKKNLKNKDELKVLCDEILMLLEDSFDLNGKEVFMTVSIGISVFPENGDNTASILKNADTAMYRAKESGKNKYKFYNEEMSRGLIRNMLIENELRDALRNEHFFLHYQPQVDLKTGRIIGTEALIRLKTENLGFVSPIEFIPVAEKAGLIPSIGEWVMRTACEQNANWTNKEYGNQRISINVSALQLKQRDFVEKVESIIKSAGLSPEMVEIEITESTLMKNMEKNVKVLKRLREIGVRTALDDFGTGYSSLNYLMMIPIDTLKIDKSFIDNICVQGKQEAMVDYIIKMAHEMGVEVVAEGVEDFDQLKMLKRLNCDVIQGYIFSKPLAPNEIDKLLLKDDFFQYL